MNSRLHFGAIIDTLKKVLPWNDEKVFLHEPYMQGNEWDYVKECLDTGWVSSAGKYVDLFESKVAEFTGVKHAVAVVNGTAALQLALQLVEVKAGDEVLVPALTFVATANAVAHCGAVPHFIDSDEKTLGVNPSKLAAYLEEIAEMRQNGCFNKQSGRRIKAVVPMHTFGHPVDIEPLLELCGQYKLELVEDAAESLGSYYKGIHTGNFGKLSILSFNGNKIVTTGGGGAILTNDTYLAGMAKHLTTQAKLPHKWAFCHDMVGYNYRMPNINAALGCAQLEQLPSFIVKKRDLARRYQEAFQGVEGVSVFSEPDFARSNYWLNVLLIDEKYIDHREELLAMTNRQNLMTRPAWTLLHKLSMYNECPRMDLKGSESLERRIINIPSSAFL